MYNPTNRDTHFASCIRVNCVSNVRTDWINATNHEDFANAIIDTNINSGTFGRVTGRSTTSNNNRIVVLGARINF